MNSRSRAFLLSTLAILSGGTVITLVAAKSDPTAETAAAFDEKAGSASSLRNEPLATFQVDLLDLAFKTASALPVEPHIKNRSRAQEAVVVACLELDQPQRALGFIEKIVNWRRGVGYADLAFYCAQHGEPDEAKSFLDLASRIADKGEGEDDQGWRQDRIRAKIARTHLWLGQTEQAARFQSSVAGAESGQADAARANLVDGKAFDERIEALDRAIATGDFDQVRNALETCAQIFDRFYEDLDRRSRMEEKIKASWKRLPMQVRIELTMQLAGFALDHRDPGKALELTNEAQALVDGARWNPEDHIPFRARLAALRHRAGDEERARSEADAVLVMFEAERDEIANIYRGRALRPLAEAHHTIGDPVAALKVYRMAVEEGVQNPNSRPRAEDLSATCCSMALHAIEPDAGLWTRMLGIHEQLGQPW